MCGDKKYAHAWQIFISSFDKGCELDPITVASLRLRADTGKTIQEMENKDCQLPWL